MVKHFCFIKFPCSSCTCWKHCSVIVVEYDRGSENQTYNFMVVNLKACFVLLHLSMLCSKALNESYLCFFCCDENTPNSPLSDHKAAFALHVSSCRDRWLDSGTIQGHMNMTIHYFNKSKSKNENVFKFHDCETKQISFDFVIHNQTLCNCF